MGGSSSLDLLAIGTSPPCYGYTQQSLTSITDYEVSYVGRSCQMTLSMKRYNTLTGPDQTSPWRTLADATYQWSTETQVSWGIMTIGFIVLFVSSLYMWIIRSGD